MDELGQLLVETGMQNVLPLPKARVPVVKFVVPDNGTKVHSPPRLLPVRACRRAPGFPAWQNVSQRSPPASPLLWGHARP